MIIVSTFEGSQWVNDQGRTMTESKEDKVKKGLKNRAVEIRRVESHAFRGFDGDKLESG